MVQRKKEEEVKVAIGRWLTRNGLEVYDEAESKRRPSWSGVFHVENVDKKRKPDLVIGCRVIGESESEVFNERKYIALEIKPGYKHNDITEGFSDILGYFTDYCWGTDYLINQKGKGSRKKQIDISIFALATGFSSKGYIYEGEKAFGPQKIKETRSGRSFYPITYSLARLLGSQRTLLANNFLGLTTIPGSKKRIKGGMRTRDQFPSVGILAQNGRKIQLVLSESPFYYRIERV